MLAFFMAEAIGHKKGKNKNLKFISKDFTGILKGFAILMVFIGHVANKNGFCYFAPFGAIGVAIFLICSGYGLNESSKKHQH